MVTYNYFLQHHGIKGQQWGVRRFQEENGTLTEEGKRRYGVIGLSRFKRKDSGNSEKPVKITRRMTERYKLSKNDYERYSEKVKKEKESGKKLGKRRLALIEKYKKQGLSQEEAEAEAYKVDKVEKVVKVAAAVVATAALAYGSYKATKFIQGQKDVKINQGTVLQRVTSNPNEDLNRAGYVSFDKNDKLKYRGLFGEQIARNYGEENVHRVQMETAKNMKIAGEGKAKKVFNELMKNDPEFKKDNSTFANMWGHEKHNDYDEFNIRLVGKPTPEGARVREKFYNKLKELGYDGVLDSNDKKYSGYNAKAPVILFNMKDNLMNRKVDKLDPFRIKVERDIAWNNIIDENSKKRFAKIAESKVRNSIAKASIGTALLTAATISGEKSDKRERRKYQDIIRQYKREHPNTKLSDRQILDNELG